jgi:membrane-associated phospholipid phosphatase
MKVSEALRKKVAVVVSQITSPILVVLVGLAILTYHYSGGMGEFIEWTVAGFLLLVGPGLIYTTITWLKDRRIDLDISKREDRIIPLLMSTMGAVFISFIVTSKLHIGSLVLFSYVLVALLVALTFTTFVWKISFHAAAPAAAVTLLILFRGPMYAWLYLAIIPVIWSRLTLKQHTPAQLAAGTFTGASITYRAFLLFQP